MSAAELVRLGYLTARDLAGLNGMEITFFADADETYPQSILARARGSDGVDICLLADGSICTLSASQADEMQKKWWRKREDSRR